MVEVMVEGEGGGEGCNGWLKNDRGFGLLCSWAKVLVGSRIDERNRN